MAFEIERKFLVKDEAWRGLAEPVRIRQGYVATKDGTTGCSLMREMFAKWNCLNGNGC
jgi:CYTH domain-containing protein